MKKRGFTLVELLAVISILAILVIVAMPNVLKMFRESKQKNFFNEVETIKNEIKKEVFDASLSNENIPPVISSIGDYQLDMDGRELDYYAELNRDGSLKYLEVSDGEFYYQYSENMDGDGEVVDLKDNNPDSKLEYIKDNVATEQIFVYDTLYDIYDETNSIPVIMSNMSDQSVNFNVLYGNTKIGSDFVVSPKTEDYIVFVKLTNSMINSMKFSSTYNLTIESSVVIGKDLTGEDIVVKHNYADKIKVKRVKPDVVITGAKSGGNNYAFNQSGIYIPKNVNVGTLNVSVKNISGNTYKIKNIFRDELIMKADNINDKVYKAIDITGTELQKYQNYLNGGIYFYGNSNNNFTMDFGQKSNIQKIYFDFDRFINPGLVQDGNITIASKENSSDTTFGDFKTVNPLVDKTPHGESVCSFSDCFGNSRFNYTPAGGIYLGKNYQTSSLQIAQSMSIDEEYSAYFTIEGNTNQTGTPLAGCSATIFAVSDDNAQYLSWVGFVNNYLQIYSYFTGDSRCGVISNNNNAPGFQTINLSEYSGKKVNIQITARRGGTTKVYINGVEKLSFVSGYDSINYSSATMGDLRPSRGLKYSGILYDLAFYNKALSADEVRTNYNYAKSKWHIN